jgi:hypothetical protein
MIDTIALWTGYIVLSILALIGVYLTIMALVLFNQRLFRWLSKQAFHLGGGAKDQHPKPPWDRLWIELSWLENCWKAIEDQLGGRNWINPAERPDIERLHELRKEEYE